MAELNKKLQLAAIIGEPEEVVRLLAAGADPNARGGEAPLRAAAFGGHLSCMRALLAAGAEVNALHEPSGYSKGTALMAAAEAGQTDAAAVLLEAGADPCIADESGNKYTAVEVAVHAHAYDVVWQLLGTMSAEALQQKAQDTTALVLALGAIVSPYLRNQTRWPIAQQRRLLAEGPLWPARDVLGWLQHLEEFCFEPRPDLYTVVAARQALTAEQWGRLPAPCPGLGAALPAVLQRSAQEAALLVRHLTPADSQRLHTAALCLRRAQRVHGLAIPTHIVSRLLALSAACE